MAFDQFLNSVNKYQDKISNGYAKFAYAVFVQAPLNILVKLSELATTPPAIFAAHMRKNQTNTESGFAGVKNRLALSLKLPFDILIGLIKVALFFPTFVLKAPVELFDDYMVFITNKVKDEQANAVVKFLVILSGLVLVPIGFTLGIVDFLLLGKSGANLYLLDAKARAAAAVAAANPGDNVAEKVAAESTQKLNDYINGTDWSVAGALSLVERSINAVVSFAARAVAEIVLSPVTLGLFIHEKVSKSRAKESEASKNNLGIDFTPPVVQPKDPLPPDIESISSPEEEKELLANEQAKEKSSPPLFGFAKAQSEQEEKSDESPQDTKRTRAPSI